MNELDVIVKQEPGTIQWNFEDLKAALSEELAEYENMIYDDSAIAVAKKDVASLRKLKTSVEDRRKEIKAKCLEPYDVIEKQAKELTGLIDRPINMIADQIDKYEAAQRSTRKARIMEYMSDTFANLPADIQKKTQIAIYDSRWENATAKETDWKGIIQNEYDQIRTALKVISEVDEDFREEAMKVFRINLSLPDAMAKVQELQKQREMLIEKQRQREEAAKMAEARRLEREKQEAERVAREAEERAKRTVQEAVRPETVAETPERSQRTENAIPAQEPKMETEKTQIGAAGGRMFRIYGTGEQINKILGYVKFIGARAEEIEK